MSNEICVGWSYGGFVSGMSLMRDNKVYKCATSVAPVTDWELYGKFFRRSLKLDTILMQCFPKTFQIQFIQNVTC